MRLILASASPRRHKLLTDAGYDFTARPAAITEVAPPHLTPGETALFNARSKAEDVAARFPAALVLGVDTLVACDATIYGKPADLNEAETMLHRLNGRAHQVFSGVWLTHARSGGRRGIIEVTTVHFRQLSTPRLQRYLARIEPLDKAGAYAAQTDNGELIERVEGSFTNVIGLPMERLRPLLEELGLTARVP